MNTQENKLPSNTDAERALLGCMILDNRLIDTVLEILPTPEPAPRARRGQEAPEPVFYDPKHQAVWEALAAMRDARTGIDLTTLSNTLRERGQLDAVGGAPYLAGLEDDIFATSQAPEYARIILKKWRLRKLARMCRNVGELACASGAEPGTVIEEAERSLMEVSGQGQKREIRTIGEIAMDELMRLERQAAGEDLPGLPTGFGELDRMTGGLKPGQMVTIAARPSVGKSAFAGNITLNVAVKRQSPVAFFSLEMSESELVQRQLSIIARIPMSSMQNPSSMGPNQREALHRAGERLSKAPLLIDTERPLSITALRSKARRLKRLYPGLALIVIDYLQLLRDSGRYQGNKANEVAEISAAIKMLAGELSLPVIALSQLSRDIEKRNGQGQGKPGGQARARTIDDEMPRLSDLRDSGSIEQDSDLVIFLARQGERARVKVAKQRNGPCGSFNLDFLGEYTEFVTPL